MKIINETIHQATVNPRFPLLFKMVRFMTQTSEQLLFNPEKKIKPLHMISIGIRYCPLIYILYILFSVIIGLFTPFIIILQTYFIDYSTNHIGNLILSVLVPSFIVYFILNFINLSNQNFISYLSFKISNRLEKKTMADYLERLSKLKYEEYESSGNQDLIYRVGQTLQPVSNQGIGFIPTILRNAIELLGILYFVILSGVWWIFPISVILSIPSIYFNKKRVQYARNVWAKDNADMRYSDYLHDMLINRESAKERKIFQYTGFISARWDSIFKKYNKNKMLDYLKSSAATGAAMFFSMSNIVVFGIFLLAPLQNNIITIGLYVSLLQMITSRFNQSINTMIREVTNLTQVRHFIQDLDDFKNLQFIEDDIDENVFEDFQSIRFDNVWFCYPNTDLYILKGVSFEIQRGQQFALIGLNGAGKTTITKLMLGLYTPTKGCIYINDRNILNYSYSQLRGYFVCMQQESANYKMTARENMGLYHLSENFTDHLLDDALEKCNFIDLKVKFNNDYDIQLTPELENGIMLSGGEWQKVAFARSIIANTENPRRINFANIFTPEG
jgi:ATP-binding cassette subfamily B protein